MMILLISSLVISIAVLLFFLLLIIRWTVFFKTHPITEMTAYPMVSILVAVRNEEHNLERCLASLLNINYPKDRLEILLGNDSSDDRSLEILYQYANSNEEFKVFDIKEKLGEAEGKANVLAHLARQAKGDYYMITDADIKVSANWVNSMIAATGSNVGIVLGFTKIELNEWQNLDWLLALGMIKVITDADSPVTGLGNNMLVTKEAYWAVGGYEKIPFSITEDFELFRQVSRLDYNTVQVVSPDVLAISKPIHNFWDLIAQRKRWMIGATKIPFKIQVWLFANFLFLPSIIALLITYTPIGILLLSVKLLLQSLFLTQIAKKINTQISMIKILLFEFYGAFIGLSSIIYYLLPLGLKWKGRKY